MNTDESRITKEVADFVGTIQYKDFSQEARNIAKRCIIDGIGVILAGGLSPGNVFDALWKVRPAGADSCTHTNRVDGAGHPVRFQKDFDKVRSFVQGIGLRESEA